MCDDSGACLHAQVLEAIGHTGLDLSSFTPSAPSAAGRPRGKGADAMEEDKAAGESGTDESANNDDMEEGDSEFSCSGGGGGDDNDDEADDDGDGGGGSDSDGEERELIIMCGTSLGRWERYEAAREEGEKTLSSTQGKRHARPPPLRVLLARAASRRSRRRAARVHAALVAYICRAGCVCVCCACRRLCPHTDCQTQ
jgi:hypothetical protein